MNTTHANTDAPSALQQEWHQGDPFRIPSAFASDRSPPLAPPKSWAWNVPRNGSWIGPPTLGGLRLLAKRPRRRRRERLQGFRPPYSLDSKPAKPDHGSRTVHESTTTT